MKLKRVAGRSYLVGFLAVSLVLLLLQLETARPVAGQPELSDRPAAEDSSEANPDDSSEGAFNIGLANLEITQGISGVPLIRYKPTLVRVYLRCGSSCEPIPGVSAYLSASFSGIPLGTVEPVNSSITVTDEEWESQRDDLSKTLNFLMPPEWTQGGINLDVYLSGSNNRIGWGLTEFGLEAEPLRVIYVPIRYKGREPNSTRIRTGASWARSVFPTNRLVYVQGSTLEWNRCLEKSALCPWRHANAQALLNELTTQYRLVNAFVYGWLPQDSFGGGIADAAFVGGANQAAFGDDHPQEGRRVFAHELAHLLGRRHTNTDDCPQAIDPGTDWPHETARIQNWGVDLSGLGWIASSASAVRSPDSTWDYMSYCGTIANGDVHTSWFTFNQIYHQNFDPSQAAPQELARQTAAESTEYIVVSGLIDNSDIVTLEPVWRFSADREPANPPPGIEYCVELRDEHGAALETRCFDLDFRDMETFEPTTVDGFNLALPHTPAATQLVVTGDDEVLEAINVSANAPVVTLLSPNGGETWNGQGTQTVTWNGSDADGDTLTYRVYYSDGSEEWIPLGLPTTESQLTVETHHLPGGSAAKVRVVATDGFNNTFDESDAAFNVSNRPPTALIEAPAAGAVSPSPTVVLQGQGYDFEEGPLSDAALSWYSDRDGLLGEGQLLTADLSLGEHEITLQVTDGDGQQGSHTVMVRVSTPPQQVELAGPSQPVSPGTYTITGTISPLTATQPITAVWQATNHQVITQTGTLTTVVQNFTWDTPGVKDVTLTVINEAGQAQGQFSLTVSLRAHRVVLPLLVKPPITEGTYQEDSEALSYEGVWQFRDDNRASGGSYATSNVEGSSLSFTFGGDSLVLLRRVGPDGGRMTVWLDGQNVGSINFYSPNERWQVPAVLDGLGPGRHTITFELSPHADQRSSGQEVIVDALALPSSYTPLPFQQQALHHVNYYRQIAGIPLASGMQAAHLGAQSHAEYVATHHDDPRMAGLGFHRQHPDLSGFTGETPSDRVSYFGWQTGFGEDGHFLGDPIDSVDGWMATVYHRNLIMGYAYDVLGYGMVNDGRGRFDVLNMGSRTWKQPESRYLYTYPANNQQNVPTNWSGGEIPDPLPDTSEPVGYPAALYIAQANAGQGPTAVPVPGLDLAPRNPGSWQVTVAELRDETGQLVPAYVLDYHSDPNGYLGPGTIFIIGRKPLQGNHTYQALVEGVDERGVPFKHEWHFTTR